MFFPPIKRGFILCIVTVALLLFTSLSQTVRADEPNQGGGPAPMDLHAPDLTPETAAAIRAEIARNVARLRTQGKLLFSSPAQITLRWPLATTSTDPGVHGISNFIDHDASFPNQLLDYNGGARTYDTTGGYNHPGTDIFLWPFSWNKMDAQTVAAVAAADGTITAKMDGNADRSCSLGASDTPNYVILTHADGSDTWYLHLKKGSVTSKSIGDTVTAGEVLGYVGSSGISTGPHLHFEVHDASDKVIDPWVGPYNPTTATSWWQSQQNYYDSHVNLLTTGFAAPNIPNCTNESPNASSSFTPGSTIYFTAYFRDQTNGTQAHYSIVRPDNTTYTGWTQTFNRYWSASYWYWWYNIPSNEATGVWKFRVVLNGETYDQPFTLCGAKPTKPALSLPGNGAMVGTKVSLDWTDANCAGTYSVQVREGSKTGPVRYAKSNLAASAVTTKKLAKGKSYFWNVSACNSKGCTPSKWRKFFVQ